MKWESLSTAPMDGTVVLFCDEHGNRWTDCSPPNPSNSCGYPPVCWMPLPAPPAGLMRGVCIRFEPQPDGSLKLV